MIVKMIKDFVANLASKLAAWAGGIERRKTLLNMNSKKKNIIYFIKKCQIKKGEGKVF